ncbi:MAG: ParB/RepB/Spo0J family partition protein [Nitrospirae bacterium]|nr:ParB/RepB/Spo0J family partition protein [Nitrospirota bacterium]
MQFQNIPLGNLRLSNHRVRKAHSPTKLEQLKKSVQATSGPLIPLVVRKTDSETYDIISGDGRYQALLGLDFGKDHPVPCLVVEMGEKEAIEFGLVDNVVREQMTPYEEALVAKALVADHGLKQYEVAKKLGKDKAYVSHLLATFQLIPEVLEALRERRIQFGHARAIGSLRNDPDAQRKLLGEVLDGELPVSEAEVRAKRVRDGGENPSSTIREGTTWISGKTRLTLRQRRQGIVVEIFLTDTSELEKAVEILRVKLA